MYKDRLSCADAHRLLEDFNGNTSAAARSVGVPRTTFKDWLKDESKRKSNKGSQQIPKEVEDWQEDKDSATLYTCIDTPCRTIEDVVKKVKVDTDRWEVEKFRCVANKWDMGCKDENGNSSTKPLNQWKLTVWFKRKAMDVEKATELVVEEMKKHSPEWPKINYNKKKSANRVAEFCVFDLHLGKLCWEDETGQDQSLQSAYDIGLRTVEAMANRCGEVNQILFPIGNDFLHIDTLFGTTTAGTRQDMDSRPHKVFKKGFKLLCEQIKVMAQIAPVKVITVPGNHDTMSAFHIGLCAEAFFDSCPHIVFNNDPTFRKYEKVGNTLIGFSHQSKDDPKLTDLPMIMAQENRSNGFWSNTEWAEFHTAHTHKKRKVEYLTCHDKTGVVVYTIPSICATDAWHSQKGFVHFNRCAELRTFDNDFGPEGIINIYPGMIGF